MNYTGDTHIDNLIINYNSNEDIHSLCFVKYKDVFEKVWDRIQNPDKYQELWHSGIRPDNNDMVQRLKQEVIESKDMCFTGKLTRLVNTLVGFYTDIELNISTNDQINARINLVIEKYGDLSIEEQKEKIREALREIDVEDTIIEEWINNIWIPDE
jgi:hypothetical protein